jgi:HEAT repeat protein
MEIVTALLVAAGGLALTLLAASRSGRDPRSRAWRAAAEKAGLAEIEMETGGVFSGHHGPLELRIVPFSGTVSVAGLGHGAGGLSLGRKDDTTARLPRTDEAVRTGSPAFDGVHRVQGSPALALALLDAETRRLVGGLLHKTVQGKTVRGALRDGVLEVAFTERGPTPLLPIHQLTLLISDVIAVALRLVAPGDLAARIVHNLHREPEEGVRFQAISVLARELSHHPAAREVLRAACSDPHDELRLRAAAALGAEGHATLRALVASDTTADAVAARAVRALAESDGLEPGQAEEELRRARTRGRTGTLLACVDALGHRGGPESEALLLPLLPPFPPLDRGDQRVAEAAARALGRVGTIAALAPLREAAEPLWGGALGHAARQAIAEIQARLTGAAPGQLSLAAGGDAGALSLAPDEPGRLSLAGEEPPTA